MMSSTHTRTQINKIFRATNDIARYLGHGCKIKNKKALAKCKTFAEFWELQKSAGLEYNKTAGDLPGIPCWGPAPTPESLKRAADALRPIVREQAAAAVLPRPEPRRTCTADYWRDFFEEWVDEMVSQLVDLLPVTEVGGVRHVTATGRLMIEANPNGITIEVYAGPSQSEGAEGLHVLSATYVPTEGGWTVTLNIERYYLIIPRRTELLMDIDKYIFGGVLRRHCESKPPYDDARLLLQEPETDESEE